VKSFKGGSKIFVKKVQNPERYSVPLFNKGRVIKIIEKPEKPSSPYALTGVFLFDADVFKIIKKLKPSVRGELELPDVFSTYIKNKSLTLEMVKGFWIDAGTFDSLAVATDWAKKQIS
jgi:glucose-1-phosphate thymidylyltransferase